MTDSKLKECRDSGFFNPIKPNLLHEAIIQRSLPGILIFQNEHVVFSNPALQKIVGFTEDEILKINPLDLVDPRDRQEVKQKAVRLLKGLSFPDGFEFRIHTAKGETRWMHLLAESIYYRGKPAVLANILDIQEREGIVGHDASMHKLFAEIIDVAACEFPVLIQGESGVGKELVAQAIHKRSNRKDRMFVPVHCASLPEGLLESELFGHVQGAFTGAIRDKKGRFELAHGGTIFLDEIGELSVAMQVKLSRILQEGVLERVGGHRPTKVDVRFVSATNKDLQREMAAGRFRRDLYYRLCVVPIHVPPLRDRKKDILLLADHFLSCAGKHASGRGPSLSLEARHLLSTYDWPGNVRELKDTVYSAGVKSKGHPILPRHLPAAIVSQSTRTDRRRRRKLDHASLQDALRRTGGNKLQAARLLGVSRSTVYRCLAAAGLKEN